jgi:hypothetical protein
MPALEVWYPTGRILVHAAHMLYPGLGSHGVLKVLPSPFGTGLYKMSHTDFRKQPFHTVSK